MNERIRTQIEMMKQQTFGVEVEMNGITRRRASSIAAKFFGTGQYEDTAYIDGYCTWSAYDQQGRKWKFSRDVSIAGPDGSKCELVTPILRYEDIYLLQGLLRKLRSAGAKSDATRGCGIHVHVGADGHTAKTLRNLANLMATHEELIAMAIKMDAGRKGSYCKPASKEFMEELNKKKPNSMSDLSDVWYESQNCSYGRNAHYNSSRYHMLNLHATFTKGTVEFRMFQFDTPEPGKKNGIHAGQLKAYVQFCLAINQMAKMVSRASTKEADHLENPKFAMHAFLMRLGFVGDEFETARDVWTRNLPGDVNYRHCDNTARRAALRNSQAA